MMKKQCHFCTKKVNDEHLPLDRCHGCKFEICMICSIYTRERVKSRWSLVSYCEKCWFKLPNSTSTMFAKLARFNAFKGYYAKK